ncbi:MAG: SDR family oxidoreductase [Deferribacteres bacterium]|nr:SDR family oxidoreductase [candidate division KSB1 bacterium]MCB9509091.1 SDR family oxidoreductase [Deferribacteres bacterium]
MEYLNSLFNIESKVAVITGGSGIIGGAMAEGLLQAGAKVVLISRSEQKLKARVAALQCCTDHVSTVSGDVLDEPKMTAARDRILDQFGRIDILINAAGGHVAEAVIGLGQSVFDLKIESLRKVTDLNLYGTVLPTLVFGGAMARAQQGSIINISSMASQRVISRAVGYSAAKAAIDNFTRWMAVELALKFGPGIRVNAIAPGFFLTEQNRTLLTNDDGSLSERGKTIIDMTPFKRFGLPDELIGTTVWLASEASKFVTGTVIPVDGGFSIFGGV